MRRTIPRQWNKKGFLPFRLEILTPVSIQYGDEALTSLEYIVREKRGQNVLYHVDLQKWLKDHGNEQKTFDAISSGDPDRIRNLLAGIDIEQYAKSQTPVLAPTITTNEVRAATRNPLYGNLYIPGSSLKGAISTPIINKLNTNGEFLPLKGNRDYEKGLREMFGGISEHAMQALKISDVMAPNNAGAIVSASEIPLNPWKQATPKPPCEAIMPNCGPLWGRIMLDSSSAPPALTLRDGTRMDMATVLQLSTKFYKERFAEEIKKFYLQPHIQKIVPQLISQLEPVVSKIDGMGKNSMLLRVGHYSHIESVTVDQNSPRPPRGKEYGTTRTLANGTVPFGWVLLHLCSMEEYEQGMTDLEKELQKRISP